MEGAVILHETLRELHTKNKDGVIFKMDFERAYDKVKLEFSTTNIKDEGIFSKVVRMGTKFYTKRHCKY
jgi:ATP-dependent RNA circularization protein (DNA/RNA ligase family)